MPNPYYTFPPDAPLNAPWHSYNRSDPPPARPRLPANRRRGITHPLPDWVESPFAIPFAYTESQSACPLYSKLPPEIRFMIFEAALGNRVLHIESRHGNVIRACRLGAENWARRFWADKYDEGPGYTSRRYLHGNPRFLCCACGPEAADSLSLNLLRAARRLYSECISIIYTRNTFNFDSNFGLISPTLQTRNQRFNLIASVELKWIEPTVVYRENVNYVANWRSVLSFPNLRHLRVYMQHLPQVDNLPPQVPQPNSNNNDDDDDENRKLQEALEKLWLDPVDDVVRKRAATLEELEFTIPASYFSQLREGIGEVMARRSEFLWEKRYRRRLEGVREGLQYYISSCEESTLGVEFDAS
ncbi:hypothetical protein FQN50_007131 [Emmonsiellopsis sp. PD_5]|nr:hypothetical protein FQN50_007131 [Emmonsiellopsis sp. PD_5]